MVIDLESVLLPLGMFAMVVLLILFRHQTARSATEARAETRKQLLDKFSSGEELSRFIATEDGRQLLQQLTEDRVDPRSGVLPATKLGVIFSTLGLGSLALTRLDDRFLFPGVLVLALGVGFLLAAWVSNRMITKWYGASLGKSQ